LPDSFNGSLIQYNTKEVPSVPTSLDDFTAPEWKGKLAVPNYDAQDFSGYGMKNGQAAMVSLIKKLKSSGNLAVVDDTSSLVSSGDKPVAFAGQLFNPNANLSVAPFDADNLYAQFSGLNTDATNSPAAVLWILWNAYDPTWLTERLTDPKFATSSMPYVGLPSSTFAQATGLIKKNIDAWTSAISSGNAEFETQATRDQWNTMIKAADKALNG
ncbi:MAG TPA: ABC transporter substrate-binding protein, partial [Micromonosporaceae bacterium]